MTPKDKAKELVDKMHQFAPLKLIEFYSNYEMARQCALIAIDLLFEEKESLNVRYWLNVKSEINKL